MAIGLKHMRTGGHLNRHERYGAHRANMKRLQDEFVNDQGAEQSLMNGDEEMVALDITVTSATSEHLGITLKTKSIW